MKTVVLKPIKTRQDLAENLCLIETGSKQVDIAQVQEILTALGVLLCDNYIGTMDVLIGMGRAQLQQRESHKLHITVKDEPIVKAGKKVKANAKPTKRPTKNKS